MRVLPSAGAFQEWLLWRPYTAEPTTRGTPTHSPTQLPTRAVAVGEGRAEGCCRFRLKCHRSMKEALEEEGGCQGAPKLDHATWRIGGDLYIGLYSRQARL